MLLLFAFSITPKKSIHDLVANHHDTRIVTYDASNDFASTDTKQIHQSGINCKCDQLIVESPFSCATQSVSFLVEVFQNEVYQKPSHVSFSAPILQIGLRGPPSFGV